MGKMASNQDPLMKEVLCVGPVSKRKRLKRWIGGSALTLLLAFPVVRWGVGDVSETVQFRTRPVQRGDLTVTITATGTLQPINQVDVGSELSGIIKTVQADFNDHVKVGQALAELDTSKLRAQVLQTKGSLAAARAKVLQARATMKEAQSKLARLEKARELSNNKVPSQFDLEAAEAALDRSKADEAAALAAVSQAQATLDANETDLAKAVIRSPVTGVVLNRNCEPGQTVAASFQAPVLFTLAEDLSKMKLHVDVDEADVSLVRDGQEAVFTVDAYPKRSFAAEVVQIRFGSKAVSDVVTYETVLSLDNSELLLRPGMTATAEITVKKIEGALLISNAALRFSPPAKEKPAPAEGGSFTSRLFGRRPRPRPSRPEKTTKGEELQRVWILRDGGPVALPVTAGFTDGVRTEVKGEGLEPGMELLVDAVSKGR